MNVIEALAAFCERHTAWEFVGEGAVPESLSVAEHAESPAIALHLVRSTRLIGFRDDVWVLLEERPDAGGVRLHAESRSRVGKGDLGQNPRNLRELLGWVRQELGG